MTEEQNIQQKSIKPKQTKAETSSSTKRKEKGKPRPDRTITPISSYHYSDNDTDVRSHQITMQSRKHVHRANVIYLTRGVPPLPTLLLLRWLWTVVLRWRRVAQVVLRGRIGVERGLRLSAVLHMHCRDRLRVRLGVVLLGVMLRVPRLLLRARRLEVLLGDIGSTCMVVL